jgi:hypothetical protein
VVTPATDSARWRHGGIPSIIEDEVRTRLSAACRFSYLVLEAFVVGEAVAGVPVAAASMAGSARM